MYTNNILNNFLISNLNYKLIKEGNIFNSKFILLKLFTNLKLSTKKNPILIFEKSIFNMIIPIKSNIFNYKGLSIKDSSFNLISSLIKFIKYNFTLPTDIKITKEILNGYNKQGYLYLKNINYLNKILKLYI